MSLINQALKILLPPRLIDPNDAENEKLVNGTEAAIERVRQFVSDVRTEAIPRTAVETLEMWYEALDLNYNPSEPLEVRQRRIATIITSIGGQDPAYLRRQLQSEFPDVDFQERTGADIGQPAWSYYSLTGTVDTEQEQEELLTLVGRLFPAHLEYIDLVEVAETFNWAVCGVGRVGVARCGTFADDFLVVETVITENGDTVLTENGDTVIIVVQK